MPLPVKSFHKPVYGRILASRIPPQTGLWGDSTGRDLAAGRLEPPIVAKQTNFVLTRRDPKGSADTIIVPALALCLLSKARQKNIQQTTSQAHKSRQNDQTNTKNTQTDTRIVGHRRLWSDFWPWRSKAPAAMRGCAFASKILP